MADNLIPLSSLLGEESDQDSSSQIVPLSSLLGEEQGPVPGAAAKRVPTSMDRGISLPVNTPVVEPLLGMQWAGKARDRLMLGFEGGQLDQEASNIMHSGGVGLEDFLKRRKDFQRRSSAANVQGDNWFSQGFYGAMQMVGPMVEGAIQGVTYGATLGSAAGVAGQVGPQAALPEELVTMPAAFAAGQMTGSMLYWQKQGEGALYADLMEQGVPHEVAAPIATGFSIPYAAIEYSQVSKVVPGMKRMVKQKIAEKVKSALKRNAIQYGSDIASNVTQEVAQELTMVAGEAVAEVISDVGMEGTPVGERIGETISETVKAMPFILAPGRMVKTVRGVNQERKIKDIENFIESAGKEEAGRQPWTSEQVDQLIESREELAGLKGHNGRVIMFSKISGRQESSEYIKIDKDSDATSAIIAHEQANPNSVYRGVFDVGVTTDRAAMDAETIEGRMEVETQYLGEGVLDPVRLGKHRIKARDIKQIIPGEVEETDSGYSVTLENGFKLGVNFNPIADQREAKINSLLSEGKIEWEAWEAMSEADQEKELAGWRVAGSFVQARDEKTGEVIPDEYITAFGVTGDVGTFRHEAVHFLRKTGLINESEYDTLRKKFARPQLELETQIRKLEELGDKATEADQVKLKALKEKLDNLQEEDVANAYAAFMHEPGSKNSIFQKVYDFFNGILMIRTAGGMMRRIDKGELASRPKPMDPTEEAEPKLSVQARNEKLVQATKDFEAGEITRADRNRVVAQEKPVVAPERFPVVEDIPTAAKLRKVLPEGKRRKVGKEPKEGETTEVRLDINTWVNKGVGVATHHVPREDSKGKTIKSVVGYAGVVALDGPVEFQVDEEKAAAIAKGEKPKHWMATIRGQFTKKFDLEEIDDTWTPVGVDPERHAYPYDKRQPSREITGGSRAIQIGTTVWTKDAESRRPSAEKFSVQQVQPKLYSRLEEAINQMPQKSATGQKWIGRIKKLRERGTVKGVGMVSPEGQSKLEIDWKMPALEALKEGETYTKDEILALLRKRDVEVTMEGGHLGEKETPLEVDTFWSDDVMGDSVEFDRDAEEVLANLPDALPQPAAGYMGNLTPHMGSETNQVLPRTSPLTASDVEVYYIRDNTLDDDGGTNPFYLFKFKNFESYFISYFKRNAAEKGWNLSHIDPNVVKRERTRFEEGGNTLVYTSYEGLDNNFQNFQGWHGIPLETAMEDLEEIIKEFYEDGPGRDMDRSGSQYDSDYYEGSTLSGPRENGTRIKLKVTPDESQAIPRTQQHFAEDELGWARVDERILADINLNLKNKWKKFRGVLSVFINELQSDWIQGAGRTIPALKKDIKRARKDIADYQKEIEELKKRISKNESRPGVTDGKPTERQARRLQDWKDSIGRLQKEIQQIQKQIKEGSGEAGFLTKKAEGEIVKKYKPVLEKIKNYADEGIQPGIDALKEEAAQLNAAINERREDTGYEEDMESDRKKLSTVNRSDSDRHRGLIHTLRSYLWDQQVDRKRILSSIYVKSWNNNRYPEPFEEIEITRDDFEGNSDTAGTATERVITEIEDGLRLNKYIYTVTMNDGTVLPEIKISDRTESRASIRKAVAHYLADRIRYQTLEDKIDSWRGNEPDRDIWTDPSYIALEKNIAREILAHIINNDVNLKEFIPPTSDYQQRKRGAVESALQSSEDEDVALSRADQVLDTWNSANLFSMGVEFYESALTRKITSRERILGYKASEKMEAVSERLDTLTGGLQKNIKRFDKYLNEGNLYPREGTEDFSAEIIENSLIEISKLISVHSKELGQYKERLEQPEVRGSYILQDNFSALTRIQTELEDLATDINPFIRLIGSIGQSGSTGIQPDTPLKEAWEQLVAMHVIEYAMARGIDRVSWPANVEQVFEIEGWGDPDHRHVDGKTSREHYKPITDRYLKLGDRLAKRLKKYNPKIEKIPIRVTRKEDPNSYEGLVIYDSNENTQKAFKSLPAKLKKFVKVLPNVRVSQTNKLFKKYGETRRVGTGFGTAPLVVLEFAVPEKQFEELTSILHGTGAPGEPTSTGMVEQSDVIRPMIEVEDPVWSMEINDKMKKAAADGKFTYKYSVQKKPPTNYQLDKNGTVKYPEYIPQRVPKVSTGVARLPKPLLTTHQDDEWVKTVPQITGSPNTLELSSKAISSLDTILAKHPTPLADEKSWTAFYADVMASKEVPVAPEQLLDYINKPREATRVLKQLTPAQITAAMNGLAGSLKVLDLYRKGKATPVHTGQYLLWGILSRGISAYPHEAAFMDLVTNGVKPFIEKSAQGNYTAKDEREFKKFVSKMFKNLEGSPGKPATQNINSFGTSKQTGSAITRSLLYKFAEREPDGRTKLQAFHEMLESEASGKDIRRAFHKLVRKPGIDNKVLSFILLVTGRHDVVIMDRIQAGHFWNVKGNKDKFKTGNLYDGFGIPGRPKSEATGLVKLFEGPRGLAFYEAAEKELAKILPKAFKQAGIKLPKGGKDYTGPFHWLTWVLTSQQVVGHDTLDAVTRDIKNAADPYNKVAVMEGKMNRWHYGVKYGIANGQPAYILTTSTGKQILTNKAGFTEYVDTLKAHGSRKNVENRIVPHGIKPTQEANIYNRGVADHPVTNRLHLDNLIRGIARRHPVAASDRGGSVGTGRSGLAIPPGDRGRTLPKFSVQAATRIQEIEGYADPELEAETAQNDKDSVLSKVKGTMGRKSQQTIYFGNKKVLRAKQGLELDEAYQGRAVRIAVDNLWKELVSNAWDSQAGFKLPKWFRVGKWAKRLKDFRKVALPLAAHLNAVNREAGQFTFADFNMRAGMMTEKEFQKKGYKPGDTITVKNELTGNLEELVIGGFIADQGRAGYQLERPVSAETQQELYNEFSERYPDLIWAVDTFIDPSLKNQRTTISGVEVPVFNRFSLEEFMKEGNATFEGLPGYTPDVIVTRSMLGALKGAFNPKAGSRSPGRKYKTGTSREGAVKPGEDDVYTRRRVGGPMDLFEGFSVRAFQVLREKARKEYFKNIIKHATEPVSGGNLKPGYVTLQTGMGQVMDAIKAFQWFESPGKWVKTSLDAAEVPSSAEIMVVEGVVYRFEKEFPETEARLSKKGNPFGDYDKFLAEAYQLRGQQRQIPKKLVDLLVQGYAADKSHGLMYRMGAWAIRNSTQSLLAHPFTYVVNALSNDAFTVEAITKHGLAGLAKLPFDRPAAKEDLTYAKNLLLSQFYKFHGVRKMLGWQSKFETFVEDIMPDDVFEGSTALADLKIQYHIGPLEYLKRGEVGAAALQAMQYGSIDVRAKQRLAYAFLKSKAVRAAKEKGLKGDALTAEIDAYMARPPKEDRLQAVELAQFEYLNYSDSPDILQRFAGNDYSRLLIPFPRFGYHWTAKQIQRVAAVKDVFGKQVPKGRRADALADFITFGLFTAGGVGFLLDSILSGGDDDDEIRERIGTARSLYYDENGELKSKALPRQLVTANRVNLSEYFRLLGIDDGEGEDFWWRVRQYPQISMAGALLMAWEDGKKVSESDGAVAGITAGVQTYAGQAKDMMSDFFTLGGGIKAFEKTARAMTERPGDRPQQMFLDPYASNVPFRFYVTDQAMTAFVPFRRQFDTVSLMLDPVMRRKTQSKTMDYYPGAWEAIQMGHATGFGRRLLDSLNLIEVEPLMAQGTPKDIAYEPSEREKDETSRYRDEALQIISRGEPEARMFQNPAGNYRLGVIPEETRTTIRPGFQALNLTGFNVRPIPRNEYLNALQPPSQQ